MKRNRVIIILFAVVVAIGLLSVYYLSEISSDVVTEEVLYIAHGLGAVEDKVLTNSREAFEYNYERGYRWFEVDFRLTADNKLVAHHNSWVAIMPDTDPTFAYIKDISYDTFMHDVEAQYSPFEPLDVDTVLQIAREHPDIYLVIDMKDDFVESYTVFMSHVNSLLADTDQQVREQLLSRIVPQVYFEYQFAELENIENFPSRIYTLYANSDSNKDVLAIVREHQVTMVTMSTNRYSNGLVSSLRGENVPSAVHTVNTNTDVERYLQSGVYAIYSDSIDPTPR